MSWQRPGTAAATKQGISARPTPPAAASASPTRVFDLVDDALLVDMVLEPFQRFGDGEMVGEGDPVVPAAIGERIERVGGERLGP